MLRSNLPEACSALVVRVDGYSRRTLRRAVSFEWTDTELVLECLRHTLRQLLRADENIVETPEILRLTATDVSLEKRRRSQQE